MKHTKQIKSILKSFKHATDGIVYVFSTQRNMKIHLVLTLTVLFFSLIFKVEAYQLLFVLSSIMLVMCMELINTAIERVVDLVTEDYHPLAKIAKDVAAGAVLFSALFAFIVGVYVFLPYLLVAFSLEIPISIEFIVIFAVLAILMMLLLRIKK
ncbi:diacylglycerol kinase family protein [Bacillus horti]|uniref:Diacylglycerol kinase n=1 Tax=Caldalkalibacillus horti TaxID=77523 RepID=A0ABT9W486_9BACI|nr:diacylglycerol kinase family protein [Bacillus horti]MDQ0168053.1 diacylglycerol kinase [Bacillus horti]